MKHIYETKKNRFTDIENRLVVSKGEGESRGKECECGISRGKLLYTGWKNNKVLLHSTGNYIQYPVINHNGKEYKERMYRDFPGSPVVKTLPSNEGSLGSIPRRGVKIPHASQQKRKT